MLLSEYMEQEALEPKELKDRLDGLGFVTRNGNPVTIRMIRSYRDQGRPIPRNWRPYLLEDPDPDAASKGSGPQEPHAADQPPQGERREAPPRRPANARIELVEPGAKKRIAGAYRFVGAALAAGSGSEGVAVVFNDQADPIADLWLQAAQENPWAARFVNMLSAGGSAGDLAAAHLYLVGGVFYVLGAGIPGGDSIFGKYRGYRPVGPAVKPGDGTAANGHEPEAAERAAEGAVEFDQS